MLWLPFASLAFILMFLLEPSHLNGTTHSSLGTHHPSCSYDLTLAYTAPLQETYTLFFNLNNIDLTFTIELRHDLVSLENHL